MHSAIKRLMLERPMIFTAAITIGWLAIGLGSGLLLPWALPSIDVGAVRALGQIALALLAAALAVRIGWRSFEPAGGQVRNAGLLALPVLFAALPLAAGLRIESWGSFAFLVFMELVVGFSEELVFRGFILRALLPGGTTRAVLVSAALFGLVHLANVVYGASLVVTLFQVVGVCAFGIGMAAIVLRTGALWPAMLIHALSNSALRFSYITPRWLPTPLMSAIVMTLMLLYGAVLLWRRPRTPAVQAAPAERLG
ncbi:MAG TPA: CPBP family intramembrane metalloprotease [Kouleothrix sp.]|uniref:CPBP family intramembrane glutamic endopeptidase n=1 Tax=Kouleothrix sp. TaxID=2779161 RepID=UPI002D0F3FF6|nr:CPBP family intramembrane metalloprotease [Kouleothrix sp.]